MISMTLRDLFSLALPAVLLDVLIVLAHVMEFSSTSIIIWATALQITAVILTLNVAVLALQFLYVWFVARDMKKFIEKHGIHPDALKDEEDSR